MQCKYNGALFRAVSPDARGLTVSGPACYKNFTNNPLPTVNLPVNRSRMVLKPTSRSSRAFSLLELLAVIAIMLVMMSLLLPAVSGFSSTAGRRGAVNIVMNTLEQARVAALESGQTVYVGFADSTFPVEDMRNTAFIVFRRATDEEAASGKSYVVLKNWSRLPRNVAFKDLGASIMGNKGNPFSGLEKELPASRNHNQFPVVAFDPSGAVDEPASNLQIFLTEAVQSGTQQKELGTRTLFEKITLSRYTGRAQLDVTTTAGT